jgi:hypothetical protein
MGLAQGCRAFLGYGPTAAIGVPKRSSEFPLNSTVRRPGHSQDVCRRPHNNGAFYNVLSQRFLTVASVSASRTISYCRTFQGRAFWTL